MPSHCIGKDAVCSILARYLHPSAKIRELYPNMPNTLRLQGFKVLRQEVKRVNQRDQLCIVCAHDNFDVEMYAVKCWFTVTSPGDPEYYFDTVLQTVPAVAVDGAGADDPDAVEIPEIARNPAIDVDDPALVAAAEAAGIMIDDDNEPAPENCPDGDANAECIYEEEWGHGGICFAKANGSTERRPRLKKLNRDHRLTRLQLFEAFFPVKFMKEVVLPQINANVHPDVTYGELLMVFGMWLKVATTAGFQMRQFWSTPKLKGERDTPFKFNHLMSKHRFEDIVRNIKLTNADPPENIDRFWEVRDFIGAWNQNMTDNFLSGFFACLDESISKWINKFTCPGFMVVPRKPWSLGNEYHTICCTLCGIMFGIDLVEGKDQPPNRPKEFDDLGKTVGKMLRLTKCLNGTGTIVIMDSGFCVLKGLVEMRKRGVFGSAMIKKRRYWPKHVDGEAIKQRFQSKEVGDADSIKGKMDGCEFYLSCMKEPDYNLLFMTTYGTMERTGAMNTRKCNDGSTKEFQYPDVVRNHYDMRDSVDKTTMSGGCSL